MTALKNHPRAYMLWVVLALALIMISGVSQESQARNNIKSAFFDVYPDADGTVLTDVLSNGGHCGVSGEGWQIVGINERVWPGFREGLVKYHRESDGKLRVEVDLFGLGGGGWVIATYMMLHLFHLLPLVGLGFAPGAAVLALGLKTAGDLGFLAAVLARAGDATPRGRPARRDRAGAAA